VAKALVARRSDLIADLGGLEAVSTQELALVEEAVKTKLILDSVDAWLLSQATLINKRTRAVLPASEPTDWETVPEGILASLLQRHAPVSARLPPFRSVESHVLPQTFAHGSRHVLHDCREARCPSFDDFPGQPMDVRAFSTWSPLVLATSLIRDRLRGLTVLMM
jgi:hypothetical protein